MYCAKEFYPTLKPNGSIPCAQESSPLKQTISLNLIPQSLVTQQDVFYWEHWSNFYLKQIHPNSAWQPKNLTKYSKTENHATRARGAN